VFTKLKAAVQETEQRYKLEKLGMAKERAKVRKQKTSKRIADDAVQSSHNALCKRRRRA
jgi:hypothetical protein